MSARLFVAIVVVFAVALLTSCAREAPQGGVEFSQDLLALIPADTPYAFVSGRPWPEPLKTRFADHLAGELALQRSALRQLRLDDPELAAALAHAPERRLLDVLDSVLVEFEGRDSAAALRELGLDPLARSALFGIGFLPAMRVEILDAAKVEALLNRVEQRAGVSATPGSIEGRSYRRIDLGPVDAVIAVHGDWLIAGMLADALFDAHLPLLLGLQPPRPSLVDSGQFAEVSERHGFLGHSDGFVDVQALAAVALGGQTEGSTAEVMRALGGHATALPPGCRPLVEQLTAAMPRMVVGVTRADAEQLVIRGTWEATPAVATVLKRLAAPVPGLGGNHDGLFSVGVGLQLPQVRNGIASLLDAVIDAGTECEWVDPPALRAFIPQLNLLLGPMTAGIKGFHLQVDAVDMDPDSLTPRAVDGGLVAAVDDPRGVVALGAMFNPALASLDIPADGSPVSLPAVPGYEAQTPPMQIAIADRALVVLSGSAEPSRAQDLLGGDMVQPPPLFAATYAIGDLVAGYGEVLSQASARLAEAGEQAMAEEVELQLAALARQADLFDRASVSVFADDQGLVMDQVMILK